MEKISTPTSLYGIHTCSSEHLLEGWDKNSLGKTGLYCLISVLFSNKYLLPKIIIFHFTESPLSCPTHIGCYLTTEKAAGQRATV